MARAETYLHTEFHLDPSNRLATIHHNVTDRTDMTGQRSDSIGRPKKHAGHQKVRKMLVFIPGDLNL